MTDNVRDEALETEVTENAEVEAEAKAEEPTSKKEEKKKRYRNPPVSPRKSSVNPRAHAFHTLCQHTS